VIWPKYTGTPGTLQRTQTIRAVIITDQMVVIQSTFAENLTLVFFTSYTLRKDGPINRSVANVFATRLHRLCLGPAGLHRSIGGATTVRIRPYANKYSIKGNSHRIQFYESRRSG